MKILIIQHLYFLNGTGGTEKIACFLANNFNLAGHEVEIATNENIQGDSKFPLNRGIKVTNIFDSSVVQIEKEAIYNYKGRNPLLWIKHKVRKKLAKRANRSLLRKMGGEEQLYTFNLQQRSAGWKKYIDSLEPDLIVTMSIASLLEITYQNTFKIPIIDSVNGRPDYDFTNTLGGREPFMLDLLSSSFSHLSGIQILFESYKQYLPENFSGACHVIPNPVPQIEPHELVNHQVEKKRRKIIHIARLDIGCKQQDILINMFSKLAQKYTNWDMELWGVGSDHDFLKEQIQALDLEQRIFLKGFTQDPLQKLKEADLFAFPSKYEGFPLALTEAMSLGLPCVGFSSCSGVNELIKDKQTGYLAFSIAEFETCLSLLMDDGMRRAQFGLEAHRSMEQYASDMITSLWDKCINEIVEKFNVQH